MKLKCQPDDFRVEELTAARPGDSGRFTFYRLSKRDIGTMEAVEAIRRRWNLAGRQVSYAGLKDRHAATIQYLTIADGPARPMRTPQFDLEPIGRLDQPYSSRQLVGNRFEIVLRALVDDELARASAAMDEIPKVGLPNYFDDQRFGSVGRSGGFVAAAWLGGDHGLALWRAIAEATDSDRSSTRSEKEILRTHWGDWAEAKRLLPRSSARSIVTYLVDHPTDYRGAFARLRKEMRMLYFSAFQSHLWNLWLARWLESQAGPGDDLLPVTLRLGRFPFPRRMDPTRVLALRDAQLPLPCARAPLPTDSLGPMIRSVLAPFQLEWRDLRIKHLKDIFLSKGSRPCLFFPEGVRAEAEDDPLHRGRRALRLAFELPKGSYATILVKRITDAAEGGS